MAKSPKDILNFGLAALCVLAGSVALHASRASQSANRQHYELARLEKGTVEPGTLKVPNAALHLSPPGALLAEAADGRAVLFIVDKNDKLQPVPVRVGVSGATYSEVLSGELAEGSPVVAGVKPYWTSAK